MFTGEEVDITEAKLAKESKTIESGPWMVKEAVVEKRAGDETVAVPVMGATILCSFFATQQYVPSFCAPAQSRGTEEARPGRIHNVLFKLLICMVSFFCR